MGAGAMKDSLEVVRRTRVTRDQIDHLGHMNVRFYSQAARDGANSLAESLGVQDDDETVLVQHDLYTRHHREQLLGARLLVRGGVVAADRSGLQLYQELVNEESGGHAASFVTGLQLQRRAVRDRAPIPDAAVAAARGRLVSVPQHGRPRSIAIDEDPTARAPALGTVRDRGLAVRQVRTITERECDADGYFRVENQADLVWGGRPAEGRSFDPFHVTPDGVRLGWASMETRASLSRLPRAGDRVQSFGADVDLQAKTLRSRFWAYDVDRGDPLCSFSVVNLAFDVGARRSVPVPDGLRRSLERDLHRDLDGDSSDGDAAAGRIIDA